MNSRVTRGPLTLCVALVALGAPVRGAETITDPAAALARLQTGQGGTIQLAFDGILTLSTALVVQTETTVDASGRRVTLDGAHTTRHFIVTNAATLRLVNLTLANGRFEAAPGESNQVGNPGCGGSIYNSGGALELDRCVFLNNEAVGGMGGTPVPSPGFFQGERGGLAFGGAVYCEGGTASLMSCRFEGNRAVGGTGSGNVETYTGGGGAAFGGAYFSRNVQSALVSVVFTNNQAIAGDKSIMGRVQAGGGGAFGGALADEEGTTRLTGCIVSANQAKGATRVATDTSQETGVAKGGGVYHGSGRMVIESTLLEGNGAMGGGGGELTGRPRFSGDAFGGAVFSLGDLRIENSTLASNQTVGGDTSSDPFGFDAGYGGMGAGGGMATAGSSVLVNSTFHGNTAQGGGIVTGAMAFQGGGIAGSRSVFEGSAYGGGIYVSAGSVSLLNVTLGVNRAEAEGIGQALGASLSVASGTLALTNTILFCTPGETNVFGGLRDGGHNISSDQSALFSTATSRSNLDPLLGSLLDNGGPTPTMALLPGSPAIDAGDDSVCPATDQRGIQRPQGLACDVGAYEVEPLLRLGRAPEGLIALQYAFQPGYTNRISGSTNLIDWAFLGTRISDAQGAFEFRDGDSARLPWRFYQVQIQSGP